MIEHFSANPLPDWAQKAHPVDWVRYRRVVVRVVDGETISEVHEGWCPLDPTPNAAPGS